MEPTASESNANGVGELHPLLRSLVSGETGHLIPPQNSPESLYNWHFRKIHSTLAKTDRKSFDFQSKSISLLRDVIRNISTLQQLIPSHATRTRKNQHHTCHPDVEGKTRMSCPKEADSDRLSQLDAMCTETKDSARSIAMHFVKNTINVSLLNDSCEKSLDGMCGKTGENSYFTRSKMIQELTENLTEIYTKKFISKHALDRFLGNVSAVDFDCYECYQLCLSAALTVQKVMLLLSLNDPDLDAMFVINTLVMSVVQVDVPCEDCRTPWCSVSEIGKAAFGLNEEDNHPRDILCRTENIQCDPFYLSLMHHTGLSSPMDSLNGSRDNIARTFNRTYSKRSGVNLNMAERSAFYSLAQIQCDLSSERELLRGLQPENIPTGIHQMQPSHHSCISQISRSFSEQPNVPNNSPSDSKIKHNRLTERRSVTAENYSQNCQEKIHVDKHLLSTPKQEWKSDEVISRTKSKNSTFANLKSVITKHASDPNGFVKNLQTNMDIFRSCTSSPRPKSSTTDVTECIRSQSTSRNNTESHYSSDTLGSIKTHSSTMEVNLRNEGRGFGLEIGFLGSTKDNPMMPIIVDVEQESAAAKTGVLLKGDRIASINGQSAVGLTVDEFTDLTKEAFAGEEVSLIVDFDVALPEVRFGTFDIYFDKDLKTGLEFKDFSKGSPLVVKGVAKGSAAHRSGQLFAGDEILFTNCIRQEAFDSRRCSYRRTEMVLMTVRRERRDSDSESNTASEASETQQYPPTSVDACAVQRTSIHTVSGSSALVLEQQIALRRDPRLKDFGFLVGQNQMTGGVYVTGIRPGGPADRSKVVKKNDRIMEIDGTPVGNKESSSLSLLLQAGDHLELVTRRVLSCKE